MKKKIIAVFKTHFDYGYTDLAANVLHTYSTCILRDTLRVCRKMPEFKWTLPSFLLLSMYDNCPKELKSEFDSLIRNGRIVCHALPFTMHTPLLDKRLAKNMFIFTDAYAERFGVPFPISAKMTDVPGHCSGIIKPLADKGVKFLHIGKNPASLAPDVPILFRWEDTRGNSVVTMYNKQYGSCLTPPKDWKYPVWLALCQTNDNVGVQSAQYVENLRKQAGEEYDFCIGTLDDFARELGECDLSDLPVVRGELGDTWIHGAGSYPDAISDYRRAKELFYRSEDKFGGVVPESEWFYKKALVFCEHTFGANILKFWGDRRFYDTDELAKARATDEGYKIAEKSWEEQRGYAAELYSVARSVALRTGIETGVSDITEPKHLTVCTNNGNISIGYKGRNFRIAYEYRVFGAQKIHTFLKKYLTRYSDWAVSDFGRVDYPEIESRRFVRRFGEVAYSDGTYTVRSKKRKENLKNVGDFSDITVFVSETSRGFKLRFCGDRKSAILLAECANLIIDTGIVSPKVCAVEQCGEEINVETDIVRNANRIMWAADGYARIDDCYLLPKDSTLVSFGKNAVFAFNGGGKSRKSGRFVANLFNTQWGTNFPQWIEGSYSFEFDVEIREKTL